MAFDLSSIGKTKRSLPERLLVHGLHKVGKTTLAANCPGVVFVPTEDGQDNVDASTFPLCRTWDDLMAAITTLYMEKHDFKAACVDSLDWAEALAHQKVASDHGVDGIEGIGYGKGYAYSADLFRELFDGLNALRVDRGMRVILLAHTEIKTFNDPLADSYDRYQIKLHKSTNKIAQEWCDVIAFAQEVASTRVEEGDGFKKDRTVAVDLGRRVLRLERSAAYDAGNRFSLPAELPLEWPALEEALNNSKEKNNG